MTTTTSTSSSSTPKVKHLGIVLAIYLCGVFMGALDSGIVTPARAIIENQFGLDAKIGIWMITAYTLGYAASIPVMGKLADKFGRKKIYLLCVFLFGTGSLLCGLSDYFKSFEMLIICRVIQAIGGGGLFPIATAEIGTTFPPAKRGMALGLVGGVYGIASVVGATFGSAILSIVGNANWAFIFFVNVPIAIFAVIAGLIFIEKDVDLQNNKIDYIGIIILIAMILSLMLALTNMDFFHIITSIQKMDVWPYLVVTIVLLPLFIWREKTASDSVINLRYFTNENILTTLLIAFISGFVMMGLVFLPQFCENALRLDPGTGGYFVIILGLFVAVGSPLSGQLIDKFGAKIVLGFGFIVVALGSGYIIWIASRYPNVVNVVISLILLGIGLGFTIGTPVNYMMIANTTKKESNSALAMLSLTRSIGSVISPIVMAGFLALAGTTAGSAIQKYIPTEIKMPTIPYAADVTSEINSLKQNPMMAKYLADVNVPDISGTTIKINQGSKDATDTMSKADSDLLQASNSENITANMAKVAGDMFEQQIPAMTKSIQGDIQKGIDGVGKAITSLNGEIAKVPSDQQAALNATLSKLQTLESNMKSMNDAIPNSMQEAKNNYVASINDNKKEIQTTFQQKMDVGYADVFMVSLYASVIAFIILLFYSKSRELESEQTVNTEEKTDLTAD